MAGSKWEDMLYSDKKFTGGKTRFILPVRIGKVKVVAGIKMPLIKKAVDRLYAGG